MRISSLEVDSFRNVGHVQIVGMANVNVLKGANGEGKTNLLEAIYFWLSGSSFRGSSLIELVKDDEVTAQIRGLVELDSGVVDKVTMVVNREGLDAEKTFLVNDQKISKSALRQSYPVVVFSPEEVDLIRSGSVHRRRIVDLAAAAQHAGYKDLLLEYLRIWRNRNQLLLAVKQHRAAEEELDVWDEQLARVGVAIVKARREAIGDLQKIATQKHEVFSASGRALGLVYGANIDTENEASYLEVLRDSRRLDIIRTHTTRGIHRDDLILLEGGKPAVDRASRGEFRSIVLSIKLAYGELLEKSLGERPVYLLDDVLSELDDSRRESLMKNLVGYQVIITTHEDIAGEMVWTIESGAMATV